MEEKTSVEQAPVAPIPAPAINTRLFPTRYPRIEMEFGRTRVTTVNFIGASSNSKIFTVICRQFAELVASIHFRSNKLTAGDPKEFSSSFLWKPRINSPQELRSLFILLRSSSSYLSQSH